MSIHHAFTQLQVSEVEQILDELFSQVRSRVTGAHGSRFARDMAPAEMIGGAVENAEPASAADWHQPELEYAGNFKPELLTTDLFQLCRQIASDLGGSAHRIFDHAIYKPPHKNVSTDWHQDCAFSRKGLSLNFSRLHFWIPMQDTGVENGCMHFLPGSHRLSKVEHDTFLRRAGSQGRKLANVDGSRSVACPILRGGLTVHTPYTLHAAGPNMSDRTRKAWIVQFAPLGGLQMKLKHMLKQTPTPAYFNKA